MIVLKFVSRFFSFMRLSILLLCKSWDPLELEKGKVVNYHAGAGTKPGSSARPLKLTICFLTVRGTDQ